MNSVKYNITLASLGFTTMLSQLILIREFLNVFDGNELIIGLILCTWMLLTALGSWWARLRGPEWRRLKLFRFLLLLESFIPFIAVNLLYLSEYLIFPSGAAKGAMVLLAYCLILLLPGCFLSGLLFTLLTAAVSEISGKNRISYSYGWESLGGIIAGVIFSTGLAYLFTTFRLLGFLALFNLFLIIILFRVKKDLPGILLLIVSFALPVLLITVFKIERAVQQLHFKNQDLISWEDTPYGNVSLTTTSGQYNLFVNSVPLLHTESVFNEEAVHFAMLQHYNPENVLIVSGGLRTLTEEALKYGSVRQVNYVDINPWLLETEKAISNWVDSDQISVIRQDARLYIKEAFNAFDVLIVNSPDPSTAQLNRYFTREFFNEARRAMTDSGILEISLGSTANYMSDEALELNQIIYSTLKQVFAFVIVITGERNFYLASDNKLGTDIASRITKAGIPAKYVNAFYIDDELVKLRSEETISLISSRQYTRTGLTSPRSYSDPKINSDLFPAAYFIQIRQWLRMTGGQGLAFFITISLLIAWFFFFSAKSFSGTSGSSDPNSTPGLSRLLPVSSSAFAGASAEFLLLFIFQVLFGNLYRMLGAIAACYMTGLWIGSIMKFRAISLRTKKIYFLTQLSLMVLMLLIPVLALTVTKIRLPAFLIQSAIFVLAGSIAFTTALIFNMASRISIDPGSDLQIASSSESSPVILFQQTAGKLYSFDLMGAALGIFLTSLIFLPLAGLIWSCIGIAGIVLVSAIIVQK